MMLEAELIKMSSRLKDSEILQKSNFVIKQRQTDFQSENNIMSREIELLRMKNKSLNAQLQKYLDV